MSAFEDFVNLELPRRAALLTVAITGFDGDPNVGPPAIISGAPVGTYYQQETPVTLWRKQPDLSWKDEDAGGGGDVEDLTTAGGAGTAPLGDGAGGLAMGGVVADADVGGSTLTGHVTRLTATTYSTVRDNIGATTDPGTGNDNTEDYSVGSRWINTTLDKEFVALDVSTGAAVWTQTTSSGATDADAIHDNVASEISAITSKAVPTDADFLLIEDAAAANAKKKITIGDLPGGGGGGASSKHAIGRLYGNVSISAAQFMTTIANRVIAYPWKLDTSRTYDALFARIHANGSGELRVGVWADLNGNPGALLADSGDLGNVAGMQSGILASFSPSSPDIWLGVRATAALQIRRSAALFRSFLTPGTDDTTDGLLKLAVFKAVGGGGALPDPFGAIDGMETSLINMPALWARPGS